MLLSRNEFRNKVFERDGHRCVICGAMAGDTNMQLKINMKQFRKNWVWNADTVHYGDRITKTKGNFYTFDGEVYKRLLNEFCIFFTAIEEVK